jgi:hypothetical protein
MRVLVTGGAGYIGSVITDQLIGDGHKVVVYDNLSKGHADAVAREATFVEADLTSDDALRATLGEHHIDAVIHMAASSLVGESMTAPGRYYTNNVVASLRLLDALVRANIKMVVFSSTAAVYGEPARQPITETDSDVAVEHVRRNQTRRRARDALVPSRARHPVRIASLFQRRRSDPQERRAPRPGNTPDSARAPGGAGPRDFPSLCLAMTIRRATAPASATTCTCLTWPARTCWRSTRSLARTSPNRFSTSGAVRGTRYKR